MKFLVSLPTPFDPDGRVDLARLRAHVLWLMTQGIDGFLPTLTTGEFPYLTDQERKAVHHTVLDTARDCDVWPCTWDVSSVTAAWLATSARDAGATTVVLPPPVVYDLDDDALAVYYTSMAREGLELHAYHDPAVTPSALSPALLRHLHREGVLAGLVDASEDLWRLRRGALERPGFVTAAGDRVLGRVNDLPLRAVVSDLANVWPAFCLRVFRTGDAHLSEVLLDRVHRVRHAGGPRALKALLGMGCRAPLVAPPDALLEGLPPSEFP